MLKECTEGKFGYYRQQACLFFGLLFTSELAVEVKAFIPRTHCHQRSPAFLPTFGENYCLIPFVCLCDHCANI